MDFIKKNKFTIIAITCFLVLVLVLVQIKNIFFPNMGTAIYGNRLEGIKDVEISKKELSTLEETLEKNETISKVSTVINGKIINVMITVGDELGLEQAKELGKQRAKQELDQQIENHDQILNEQVMTYEEAGYIEVEVTYEVQESIGTKEKIVF